MTPLIFSLLPVVSSTTTRCFGSLVISSCSSSRLIRPFTREISSGATTIAPFFVLAVSLGPRSFPSSFPASCVWIQLLVKAHRATPCVCARDTTMHNAAFMSVSSFAYCSPGLHQTPGHLMPLLFLLCTTQPCKHIS